MNNAALHNHPYYIEIISGLAAFGWGVYVLCFPKAIEDLPSYYVLTEYLPAVFWGWLSAVFGATQAAIAIRGERTGAENRWTRWWNAWIMLIWWQLVAFGTFQSGVAAPGSIVFIVIAFGNVPTIVILRPRAGFFGRRTG